MDWIVPGLLICSILFLASYWISRLRAKPVARTFSDEDAQSQIELDEYRKADHSKEEIGRMYERYIGYLHEREGHDVEYRGAVRGLNDKGIDLVIKQGREILVVQAKYWNAYTHISTFEIFQFYGASAFYKATSSKRKTVKPVFYSKSNFNQNAREAAEALNIEMVRMVLDKSYPMIKCNVNADGEKIYHLPTDEFYDMVKIEPAKKEFYAHTVKEAVEKGFRRARKFRNVG